MPKEIVLGNLKIGTMHKPVFVAELGINHQGDKWLAHDMVDAAVEAGADVVKFQHHLPEYEMVGNHQWQQLMRKCALPLEDLAQLQEYVEDSGKVFLCTPFSREAADELDFIAVRGFKTGSGECNHTPFLEHVARKGKPVLISTGMSSREELIRSLDAVRKINPQVVLLNCTSTYPAKYSEARLRRLQWLQSTFGLPVGQSDHTPTISTALGALALGAVCIEKHLTLDKTMPGPDHSGSILPREFKQMVDMGLEIWEGLQDGTEANMGILARERPVREIANHSLVTTKPVAAGDVFAGDNLWAARPGTGIPAYKLKDIMGYRANKDLPQGHLLLLDDIRYGP